MPNALTLRQQEFCRRFAAGLPAAKAALAAGYAQSTAETNAARLLAHPLCASYIARLREHMALVTPDSLRAVADTMVALAQTPSDDPRAAIAAAEQVRLLALVSPRLALVPLPDKTPTNSLEIIDKTSTNSRHKSDRDKIQDSEYQVHIPCDIDTLPDGTPAFDLRLGLHKREQVKKAPVQVSFTPHRPF